MNSLPQRTKIKIHPPKTGEINCIDCVGGKGETAEFDKVEAIPLNCYFCVIQEPFTLINVLDVGYVSPMPAFMRLLKGYAV
ncbi:uncharacterized protein LOC119243479 isoform X2 [Talpa occidentalis]|uniref:uncharacterized protein LOC119243479 isoform X2 n=1 Tax=Talpa occidentalis TaxID=50954 RepID=UPI0018901D3D|nr:uncharacterized protein LOC119243479 isoform X2 [Talpa occidentalis]